MKKSVFLDVIVFLFMFLFIYASVTKLLEYDLFKAQIGKSPLITRYAGLFSWMVPGVELIVAGLLFFPRFQLIGLYGCFALMFAFTSYIGFILAVSPYLPCACGGILNNMGWTEHLVFNIAFTLLSIVGIGFHTDQRKNLVAY